MKLIENKSFDCERALYGSDGIKLKSCTFEGERDGESALKESKNIIAQSCNFKLRYPFWHDECVQIIDCKFEDTARAPLWYTKGVRIKSTEINSPKALRECKGISIEASKINSVELGWDCKCVHFLNSKLSGEYFMLRSRNINMNDCELRGKYSFQYVKNAEFNNCYFDTKDAFWHAENVTVKNSYIKGEYLGWYSKNLTLVNCIIIGTQPFCYAKRLVLKNCEMHECDLAFEKSEVNATIKTSVISIKNPKRGKIIAKNVEKIIKDDKNSKCRIIEGEK